MKFINDLDHPVLIRTNVHREGNWQYHTLNFYTSSEAPDREVELTNWKKWDVYSEGLYSGSFDRIVKDGGNEVRKDNFYTRYFRYY